MFKFKERKKPGYNKVFRKKKAILISVLASLLLFLAVSAFTLICFNSMKQREMLYTTDKLMSFSSRVERMLYSNVTLLQGYEAYLKSNLGLEEEATINYLDNLLSRNSNYIRNIGVIEDTTMMWNYPKESNSAMIGVDLSKLENQKDLVLKVKNELVSVLQGPVQLVQGGTGFIVRIPISRKLSGYWGQISIVLDADKVISDVETYAKDSGLDVAVYSYNGSQWEQFMATKELDVTSSLAVDIDSSFISWKVYAQPTDGWANRTGILWVFILTGLLISGLVGAGIYVIMKKNYQLKSMSIRDSLTDLYNRHFLHEYQSLALSAARRKDQKVGLMNFDLNYFKEINDTYGHKVGDMALIEVARILKSATRSNEAVFRLGGDEFLIVFTEIDRRETMEEIKNRLTKLFNKEFQVQGFPVKVSLSVGYALFPDDGDDIDVLIQIADQQMYADKENYKEILVNEKHTGCDYVTEMQE